jgi:phage-related protein
LKGFKGAGVLEIVSDFDGNTFRAVYTVRLRGVIYVLHAFQKKSRHGIKTPLNEIEKVKSRLKDAEVRHQIAMEVKNEKAAKHKEQR